MQHLYLKDGSVVNMVLNSNQIQEIIPHRYPMLLVDQIVALESGVKAVGVKAVTANEPFFQGHFPQEHVMPGVLIIEALAQTGAVALLSQESFKGKTAYFAGINKARFKRKVIPGHVLKLEVEITKLRGPVGIGKATAFVDDQVVCEAELMFAIG
jgi:3-hydroxyacyl-[acyl-carrier-protein] dehydratase